MNYRFTLKSANRKTGPIPVSTTSSNTCPSACPFKGNGCYAESQPLLGRWREVDEGKFSTDLTGLCDKIAALPEGTLWRHNQAGDLPGEGDRVDGAALGALINANQGRRGFTYTHKPVIGSRANQDNGVAIHIANNLGFTINLSANNLEHADALLETGVGPVVTVLPSTVHGNQKITTPAGNAVVVCPATYRDDVTCKSCGLCQRVDRDVIVGFPAHGSAAKAVSKIAQG
jgi:hypothetical protein